MTEDDRWTTETMTDSTRGTTGHRPSMDGETEYRQTLGEVSHTNPYTGTVFGDTQTYSRGRTVAADGGEPEAVPGDPDEDVATDDGRSPSEEGETLENVDHTPAGEVDGAQAAHDRGEETTSEPGDE